jgi:hypothetical protein
MKLKTGEDSSELLAGRVTHAWQRAERSTEADQQKALILLDQ